MRIRNLIKDLALYENLADWKSIAAGALRVLVVSWRRRQRTRERSLASFTTARMAISPLAGVDVLLIQLQGGMQTVASTKTDAEGRYHFDNPAIGGGPMLIRAVYRGVFFHQPLTPGTTSVDVTVFEPTTNPACRASSFAPACISAQRRQADGRRRVFHHEQLEPSGGVLQAGRQF